MSESKSIDFLYSVNRIVENDRELEDNVDEQNSIRKYRVSDSKVQNLMKTDIKLRSLILYIGDCDLFLEKDGFKCLVKYIIGQQISDRMREKIWKKLFYVIKEITPTTMMNTEEKKLREIGISRNKIKYISAVSKAVSEKKIDLENLYKLPNEDIIRKLTDINGIGRWTAEMYLIFSLGRENVFSKGDGTIKRVIKWMYNLDELPSSKQLEEIFSKWKDYSTIVSCYMWKSIELGLTKKAFNEVMSRGEYYNDCVC